MAKYTELCTQVLENVGGKENISGAVHCMTRLRLTLKDESKVNIDAIKGIKGVLGAQFSGGQFQVIIGQHVSQVYPEFCAMAGVGEAAAIDEDLGDKEPFNIKKVPSKMLDYISGSMAPIIPIMMAAGFFKMFYSIFGPSMLNIFAEDHAFMQTLYLVGDGGLYFLPIFAAWSASKKLKTSTPMAMLLGAIMLHPTLTSIVAAGEPFSIYGVFPMQLNNYSSSIIPILLTVWVLKYVYEFFDKHMINAIRVFGVPFCTIVVMLPISLCVLAPLGNLIGTGLAAFFSWLYSVAGPVAIALIAAFWPFFVATGMHIAIIQIALINITTLGYDPVVLAGSNIANYALMGMALAYFIRSKGDEKQLAGANAITLIAGGISEPTLFAVLLRNTRAMVCQIAGGFIGGLVGGFMGVAVYTLGASNFLTVLQYAGGPGSNFVNACIACAVAFVVSCAVGIVIGFGDKESGLKDFKPKKKAAKK